MNSLDFAKMNGAGNDFVMLDNREGKLSLNQPQIEHLCDRHKGIGADGVLILESEIHSKRTSFRMRYYNADGREAEMCGNGARCFTRYLAHLLKKTIGKIAFETKAGLIEGELIDKQVKISMTPPHHAQLNETLTISHGHQIIHSINTGVPHVTIFLDDLTKALVASTGRELRYHPRFSPAGTNVNFVQVIAPDRLAVRTYERGVEGETLACGTGVVASALIHHLLTGATSPIFVSVQSGDTLQVEFSSVLSKTPTSPLFSNVSLTGPADFVFAGTIAL